MPALCSPNESRPRGADRWGEDGKPSPQKPKPKPKPGWGFYTGEVEVKWLPDGRNMQLLNEYRYTEPKPRSVEWTAKKGYITDGASIPHWAWSLVGGPFEGKYRNGAILHDAACSFKTRTSDEAHMMFYEAMQCSGVGKVKAKLFYFAVYKFGPRWSAPPPLLQTLGMKPTIL